MDKCQDIVLSKRYRVNLYSFDAKRKHVTCAEYTIYMDGGKLDKGVGQAQRYITKIIIPTLSSKLLNAATVFQAELMGIKNGCEFFFGNPVNNKYI